MTLDLHRSQFKAMGLLSAGELLVMALWFSASASAPALQAEWKLSDAGAAWLTLAVQCGFVAGTLLSALINLPDVVNVRHLFAFCSLAAAAANAALALYAKGAPLALALRFLTGLFLAGVYPPGMKLMASWFRGGRGMAIGVLVGALTIGKALPYLINGLGTGDWRTNGLTASALALAGGLLVLLLVAEGPYAPPIARFDLRQVQNVFRNRGLRLANFGYFGHMWELYAMWTWAPAMIRSSFAAGGYDPRLAEVSSFSALGAGALGCIGAGALSDRLGRTFVTSAAMAVSAACCLTIGLFYHANPIVLLMLSIIWGAAVVADSAQFSACITELGEPSYIGTALTLQTCIGFLLTTLSMRLIPILEDKVGWHYAFVALAPGPLLGIVAMLRLRALPEAHKIAQGRR